MGIKVRCLVHIACDHAQNRSVTCSKDLVTTFIPLLKNTRRNDLSRNQDGNKNRWALGIEQGAECSTGDLTIPQITHLLFP